MVMRLLAHAAGLERGRAFLVWRASSFARLAENAMSDILPVFG